MEIRGIATFQFSGIAAALDRFVWSGVLFGIGNALDPEHQKTLPRWLWGPSVVLILFLTALVFIAPLPIVLMSALILTSPAWPSAMGTIHDGTQEGRYYFTLLAPCLFLGWFASHGTIPLILAASIVLFFAYRTWNRVLAFSSLETFWKTAIEEAPHKSRPSLNFGAVLMAKNDPASILWSERGYVLSDKEDPSTNPEKAASNLAKFYLRTGNTNRAWSWIALGFDRKPTPLCHETRAMIHASERNWKQAIADINEAMQDPQHQTAELFTLRALCFFKLRQMDDFTRDIAVLVNNMRWEYVISMVPDAALDQLKGPLGQQWNEVKRFRMEQWRGEPTKRRRTL